MVASETSYTHESDEVVALGANHRCQLRAQSDGARRTHQGEPGKDHVVRLYSKLSVWIHRTDRRHTVDQFNVQEELAPESVPEKTISRLKPGRSATHFDRYRYPK